MTTCAEAQPKGINYRMSPRNLEVLTRAGIDCCVLANNHVLDWGEPGLLETLDALAKAGLRTVGAGRDHQQAQAPAQLPLGNAGRLVLFALASPTAGVPGSWAAGERQPGVNYLGSLNAEAIRGLAEQRRVCRKAGDIVVVSLHWGGNWGYEIPPEQRAFAHQLIDEVGVDLVWGHSSHHPKGIEVHNGRLILYGCGDFINDYEGITGYEGYRTDLVLMYLPRLRQDGCLIGLNLVPMQFSNFRLTSASETDALWLSDCLSREGRALGTRVVVGNGSLELRWGC